MKITLSELRRMVRRELKLIKEAPQFGLSNAGDVVNILSGMPLVARGKDSTGRLRKGVMIEDDETFFTISSILSDKNQLSYFVLQFKNLMGGYKVLDIVAPDGSYFSIDFAKEQRVG